MLNWARLLNPNPSNEDPQEEKTSGEPGVDALLSQVKPNVGGNDGGSHRLEGWDRTFSPVDALLDASYNQAVASDVEIATKHALAEQWRADFSRLLSLVHCYLETEDKRPAEMFIDCNNINMSGLHFHAEK